MPNQFDGNFGFGEKISINIPPSSISGDQIISGSIEDKHISGIAEIQISKIHNLKRTLDSKISRLGDGRMLGDLDINNFRLTNLGDPVNDLDAVTKKYVDDTILGFGIGFTPINKAGDTMTGFLTLAANPLNPLHAATKQYVDGKLDSLGTGGDVFKAGNNNFTGNNNFSNLVVFNSGFNITSGICNLTSTVNLSGILNVDGSINLNSGSSLTLGKHPTFNFEAATKQYVDDAISSVATSGDVFTNQNNTLTGVNTFTNNVNIGNSLSDILTVNASSTFAGSVNFNKGITVIGGDVNLGDPAKLINLNTSVNVSENITFASDKTSVLGKDPVGEMEAATKQYVDQAIVNGLNNVYYDVNALNNLPITAPDRALAYVRTIPALYTFDLGSGVWLPLKIYYTPNWRVTGSNIVSVDVKDSNISTTITLTVSGFIRYYLYRRSDFQIDISTTPPNVFNGNYGILEVAGTLKYIKPYIGSVVGNGIGSLRKEYKINRFVRSQETTIFFNPTISNTNFNSVDISNFLPTTSNYPYLMVRLIIPSNPGFNDLEMYTRPTGSNLSVGSLSAGHYNSTAGSEQGSYHKFETVTNESKFFDYKFTRLYSTTVNFYYLGYQEII